jgi:hypothetical protein
VEATMQTDQLELPGLSGDEQLALSDEIERESLRMEVPPAGGGRAGEPITIAVILLGKAALIGLSAFLLRRRKKGKGIHIGDIRIKTKKGVIEAKNVELELPPGKSSAEDVAKALSEKFDGLLDEYLK